MKKEPFAKMKNERGIEAYIYAEPGHYHDWYWAEMTDGDLTCKHISYVRLLQHMIGLGFKKVPLIDEEWEQHMLLVEAFGGCI